MKTVIKIMLALALILVSVVIFAAMKDTVFVSPHVISPNDIPIGGTTTAWLYWGIGIVLFLYEVIVRCIPSLSNNSFFHLIGVILDFVAGIFNGKGNLAKLPDGTVGAFKSVPTKV
jgi:hypothetical protein